MNKRDVGGMGESVLRMWAHERGAAVNKAEYDRGGWDFVLEWARLTASLPVPLDRQAGVLQCLVQVKATDSASRRRSVTLRNWQRFTTTPLPAFFLILEFDGASECRRAFLRHHWEADIDSTLKRLRELDAAGNADLMGQSRVLRWDLNDQIRPTSAGLFSSLEKHIDSSLGDYSKRKARLVNELGYDIDVAEGVVRIPIPSKYLQKRPEDLFTDLHLGILPHVETSGGTIWDKRYGIRSSKPLKEFDTVGRLEGPKGKAATVRLVKEGKAVSFPGTLFAAVPAGDDIDVKRSKIRICLPFVDIVFDYGTSRASLRFLLPSVDERRPLAEFASWGKFVTLTRSSEAGTDELTDLRVEVDGLYAGNLEVRGFAPDPNWTAVADLSMMLAELVKRIEDAPSIYTSARDLLRQKGDIDVLAAIHSGGIPHGRLMFDLDESNLGAPSGRVVAPMLHWVRTSDHLLVFPCLHFGEGSIIEEDGRHELSIVIDHSQLQHAFTDPVRDDIDDEVWHSWLDHAARSIPDGWAAVRWWSE